MGFSGWQYCQNHTITIASEVTDYAVPFTVYAGGGESTGNTIYCNNHCNNDFSDVRFSTDGVTALSYWVESYTESSVATIWVKFTAIATTQTVSVIYGNATATSESNGDDTFLFFDEFNGTSIDTNKWTVTGAVSVSGGICTIPSGTGNLGISGKTGYGAGKSIGFTANPVAVGTSRCLGLSDVGGPTAYNGTVFEVFSTGIRARSIKEGSLQQLTISGLDLGIYHTFEARWKSSEVTFYVDGVLKFTATSTLGIPIVNLYPRFTNLNMSTVMYISAVYVRNLATNEPIHSTWVAEGRIGVASFQSLYMLCGPISFTSPYYLGPICRQFASLYETTLTQEFQSKYNTILATTFEDLYDVYVAAHFATGVRGGIYPAVSFRTRIKADRNTIAAVFEEI